MSSASESLRSPAPVQCEASPETPSAHEPSEPTPDQTLPALLLN